MSVRCAKTVISLYSGAGGLDLGFVEAGFDVVWANDVDKNACATFAANLSQHVECSDVLTTSIPEKLDADIVIGGPPCQGFSVIGKMDQDDPRSRHVNHFLDVVERVEPSAFVMENVKALATNPRWAGIKDDLIARAEDLGFTVEVFVLNAAHYGVPQARERMFMVGIRDGTPRAPAPTTEKNPPTVRDALLSLPLYGTPGNDGVVSARIVPAKDPIMRPSAFRGSLLFNGSGRPLDLDRPSGTLPASMGGNATPIIDQISLTEGSVSWVVDYHERLSRGRKPRKTAPKRLRRLTSQEAAALQSFPPDFEFSGSLVAQLRQIGNAVPPRLAYHVATALDAAMEEARDSPESLALAV